MRLLFKKSSSLQDFQELEELANSIWHEHYTPIIGSRQVTYMMEKFQRAEFMLQQSGLEQFQYYTVKLEDVAVGYMAYQIVKHKLFLSKFYLKKDSRGKGFSRSMLEFLETKAELAEANTVSLTVNKFNTGSIAAYQAMGFVIKEEVVIDIGEGFIMDDFRMEKKLM